MCTALLLLLRWCAGALRCLPVSKAWTQQYGTARLDSIKTKDIGCVSAMGAA